MAVHVALFGKQELTPLTLFQCYLVTRPSPPSLPPEPAWRGWQPCGITCYMVATGFLHPVEPQASLPAGFPAASSSVKAQAPRPAGYPSDYANCLAHPDPDAN